MTIQPPTVSVPSPHASWGSPTLVQLRHLQEYTAANGPMSIYGDDGVYRKLEDALSKSYKVPYCVLTNSGTSALNSGYFGLGVQASDEVLVPTYTFLATVTPLLRLGARLVFCDADPATGNISPEDLARKITPKTKVVAITHMWGVPCEMAAIMPVIKNSSAKLLEDCSHAHFTSYKGKMLGTFGDVACFSIGAKKTMTSGEGGFLLTSDPEVYVRGTLLGHFALRSEQAIEFLRSKGMSAIADKYADQTVGFGENYRMHPYSAVMANAVLETGEIFRLIDKRRSSLKYLSTILKAIPGIHPPDVDEDYYSGAMYGFKARIDTRNENELRLIVEELRARNANIKLPDSGPLHVEAVFAQAANGRFPGAYEYLRGRVSLPTFSGGLPEDTQVIDQYGEVLTHVLGRYGRK